MSSRGRTGGDGEHEWSTAAAAAAPPDDDDDDEWGRAFVSCRESAGERCPRRGFGSVARRRAFPDRGLQSTSVALSVHSCSIPCPQQTVFTVFRSHRHGRPQRPARVVKMTPYVQLNQSPTPLTNSARQVGQNNPLNF